MEINLNANLDSVSRTNNIPVKPREVTSSQKDVSFEKSTALNQALADIPNVRTEAVERGQALVGSVPYPPQETVSKLSHLLALRMDREEQNPS